MKKSKLLIAAFVSAALVFGCSGVYEDDLVSLEESETTITDDSVDDNTEDPVKTNDAASDDDSNAEDNGNNEDPNSEAPEDPENPSSEDPEDTDPEPPVPLEEKGMPVIYITPSTNNTDFVTEPVSKVVKRQAPEPYYVDCNITVVNKYEQTELSNSPAEVKVRGNWTTSYDKKALRIKFKKDEDGNKKHSMLGLNNGKEFKNWVLLAEYKDWSMLRNSCALKMAKIINDSYYASDFQLVNVYFRIFNEQENEYENKYWGVYLLAEQQEINKNRVKITEADENYTGTDIGYLLEFDSYADNEEENQHFEMTMNQKIKDINGTEINTGSRQFNKKYTIKNDVYSADQTTFIKNYMNNVWQICYSAVYENKYKQFNADYTSLEDCPDGTTCQQCIEKIIDVNSLVATYVLQEIVCDPDLYYSSFYMDVDFGKKGDKKLRFEAPWDFDSTLGNKNHCYKGEGFYAGTKTTDVNMNKGDYGNPWMLVLINQSWFQEMIKDKLSEALPKIQSEIPAYIDEMTTKYASDFAANTERWKNISLANVVVSELNNTSKNCKSQAEAADWLKKWLGKRFTGIVNAWK